MRHLNKKNLLILSILLNIALIIGIYHIEKFGFCDVTNNPNIDKFDLLSEKIAWMDLDDFLEKQKTMTISYQPLKEQLIQEFDSGNLNDRYSLYFEDLNTDAWIGINEKEKFLPASLLKLPTVIAILKKVQIEELSLDQKIILSKDGLNQRSGKLYEKGAGYELTLKQLMQETLKSSDNTAFRSLNNLLTVDEYTNARLAMGLPKPDMEKATYLSPKEYSNIFRSLYLSTYLKRQYSQAILSMLAETEYETQIPEELPEEVKVAHKVGFYGEGGYVHDCGIIYAENHPYILCVMSKDSTMEEANAVISKLSHIVYDYTTN